MEIDPLGPGTGIAWSDNLWRSRPPDSVPSAENRKRFRPHQPGHDADVDLLRRLLFLPEISGDGPSLHQSPSANRAQRRAAIDDHRRRVAGLTIGATAGACSLGRSVVYPCSALVSLDVGQLSAVTETVRGERGSSPVQWVSVVTSFAGIRIYTFHMPRDARPCCCGFFRIAKCMVSNGTRFLLTEGVHWSTR